MKKKLFSVLAVVAIVTVAGYNVYNAKSEVKLSDLALANVEALANGESSTGNTGPGKTVDCPGWGTGDGKMCMCTNSNPCTETPC